MRLPTKHADLVDAAKNIVETCRVSAGQRAAAYRQYGQWIETGRQAGGLALANLLYSHEERLSAHLFSPSDLRFNMDFENHYDGDMLKKAKVAAGVISREWERRGIDMLFGQGVRIALDYGSAILKQMGGLLPDGRVEVHGRLVMPWCFGVYNEGINALADQEACCETVYINKHEAWRRIRHLPDADKLYKTILGASSKAENASAPSSFMHQVLSTAVLNTSLQNNTQPQPGGIVQLSNDPNFATLGPTVGVDLIPMHEIYVRDDERDDDYTTMQLIEPGILVAPRLKRVNLFCPDTLPYTLIQPNTQTGYFWGRSEIVDLMQLQDSLTTTLDDLKKIIGKNYDKLLVFPGFDGLTDEVYDQFHSQGHLGLPQGASVTDVTPQIPQGALDYIKLLLGLMDQVSGFSNILSGQGESGVRAGTHAETLLKTASPRLRDRSLLVERQCASAADNTLAYLEAKDAKIYWVEPDANRESDFLLSQLPEDRRITVDSHSSSPIYQDNHQQLVAWGLKSGVIGPEDAIEDLPFSNKDRKLLALKAREEAKQKLIQEHPELLTGGKAAQKGLKAVGG